jgi:hypothetical protein
MSIPDISDVSVTIYEFYRFEEKPEMVSAAIGGAADRT